MARNTEIATTHKEYPGAVVLTTTRTTTDTEVFPSFDEAERGLRRRGLVKWTKATVPLLVGSGGVAGLELMANADGDVNKTLVESVLIIAVGAGFTIFGMMRAEEEGRKISADQLEYVRDLTMPTEEATEAKPQNTPFL
ncbi:MAG: hypothetical protein HY431_01965 [Candidatus Levybacteria bacterium]|nr:hypothetical protein [Candidatus Levybacteria bacterium]